MVRGAVSFPRSRERSFSCWCGAVAAIVCVAVFMVLLLNMSDERNISFGCDFKDGIGCQIRFSKPLGDQPPAAQEQGQAHDGARSERAPVKSAAQPEPTPVAIVPAAMVAPEASQAAASVDLPAPLPPAEDEPEPLQETTSPARREVQEAKQSPAKEEEAGTREEGEEGEGAVGEREGRVRSGGRERTDRSALRARRRERRLNRRVRPARQRKNLPGRQRGGDGADKDSRLLQDMEGMFDVSPGTPGPCAEGCTAHGNCNEETGRCECPIGKTGEDCSLPATPACQLTTDLFTECSSGNMGITACECLEQCMRITRRVGYDMMAWCYNVTSPEDRAKIVTDPQSLSEHFMFGSAVGVASEMTFRRDGRHPRIRPGEVMPLDRCPNSCNRRGSCVADKTGTPKCRCFPRYRMADCSSFQGGSPTFCAGGCSGRGVCTDDAFCHCEPGRWGQDCSLSRGPDGRTTLWGGYEPPEELRPKIFVYDLGGPGIHMGPTWLHLVHGWVSDFARPTETMIRNRLLASRHRTADPEKADYFYVPLAMGRQTLVTYLYITRRYPYWNRTNGADHLWFTVKDTGLHQATQHWPRTFPRVSRQVQVPVALNDTIVIQHMGQLVGRSTPRDPNFYGCFRKGQDILLPPLQAMNMFQKFSVYAGRRPLPRDSLLFFAGAVKPGTVRGLVHEHHAASPGFNIVSPAMKDVAHYWGNMTTSKFCLAPPGKGAGWGRRTTLVALFGCIPVIVQDHREEAFEEMLDFTRFSVRIAENDVARMADILNAFTEEQVADMQRELECVWPRWVFSSNHGAAAGETGENDVFASLMLLLRRRLEGKKGPLPSACEARAAAAEEARAGGAADGGGGRAPLCDMSVCVHAPGEQNRRREWTKRALAAGMLGAGEEALPVGAEPYGGAVCIDREEPPCD